MTTLNADPRQPQTRPPFTSTSTVPFVLPGAWASRQNAPGADRFEVKVDLSAHLPGLRELAGQLSVSWATVLLTGHLAVLSMLTPDPAFHTDVADGVENAAVTVPYERRPGSWRAAVTRVSQAMAGATGQRPPAAGTGHVLFQVEGTTGQPSAQWADQAYGLQVVAGADRLLLRLDGQCAGPQARDRLAQMYQLTFEAMSTDPDGDACVTQMPAGEREQVLGVWSVGARRPLEAETVLDLIQAQVSANLDATAVRTATSTLSYRELDEQSNQLAHRLRQLGAGAEAVVGVSLTRNLQLLPALLGVWKAGAGYLPLDPTLPAERLRQMMRAAGCELVVSQLDCVSALDLPPSAAVVLVDAEREALAALPRTPLPDRPDPAQLAYLIYTSGSTGEPKGVMVQHGGLVNYLAWTMQAYGSRGHGGAPVFSSISFDLGIPNMFTPLACGQSVYLLPEPFDPLELTEQLVAGGPYSFIKMTPGHADLLAYQLTAQQARDLAGVVIAAGDSFPAALATRWHELAGPDGTAIATEYGPTEITIGNSGQLVVEAPDTELVPLGAPIPNTTMYVLTEYLEPVPIGVPGEIYIGGSGVARGYLGRPDLTVDRFLPDPYGEPGARLYRSGDLGRWLPGGQLEFLGRIDNQVKIRGYRVELGEIQANLCRHPAVRDAVVIAREAPGGDKRLVGYVVAEGGEPPKPAELRSYLSAVLPDYMVPASFVAIDSIPLTTNGKVDGRALPAPR